MVAATKYNQYQELAERINSQAIEHVIARYANVEIKPAGHDRLKCLCPFHTERTPSFMIYTDTNSAHCFGSCGKSWDNVGFIMEITGLGFYEAIDQHLGNYDIEPRQVDRRVDTRQRKPFTIENDQLKRWCNALLNDNALMGWLGNRGIDEDAVARYWIGTTSSAAGLPPGEWITIPVMGYVEDVHRFVAVECRNMHYGENDYPKYWLLGQRTLYNLPLVYRESPNVIVVNESALDAIAQNGIVGRAVATALPAKNFNGSHALALSTFSRVIWIVDQDSAGAASAQAALGMFNPGVLEIVSPPYGKDYGEFEQYDTFAARAWFCGLVNMPDVMFGNFNVVEL